MASRIDKSSDAILRKQADNQAAIAQAMSSLAAELLTRARALPVEDDLRAVYEHRAIKLSTAAATASGQATRAAQAILQSALLELELTRSDAPPAPAPGLDDYKARLAARKGAAQGGQ